MGKKLLITPRSKIRATLRQLWLRSRERAVAIKRDGYTCQRCGRKQSVAKGREFKVQVHHLNNIANWETIIDSIYDNLLCDPKYLVTMCKECHDKEHEKTPSG